MGLPSSEFTDVWPRADGISGWMTRAQGNELWDAVALVPDGGRILEIGSHKGRSTVVIGTAAKQRGAEVIAVDPFIEGRLFGGTPTRAIFEANIAAADLDGVVRLVVSKSTDLRPTWTEPLDMLYIDGKHDYWTVADDLRWVVHLREGAPVLIHDSFSSIGVTLGLIAHVLFGSSLRYAGRAGSLASFRVGRPSQSDRLRLAAQLPWFVRNVVIKIGLRFARLAGYHGTPDPY
jgi:hypothetical protein